MKVIWKYKLALDSGPQHLEMPENARGIFAAMQNSKLTIWVEVDGDYPLVKTTFQVLATGETFEADSPSYVGTAFDGLYVWHVYQLEEEK